MEGGGLSGVKDQIGDVGRDQCLPMEGPVVRGQGSGRGGCRALYTWHDIVGWLKRGVGHTKLYME